MVENLRTSETTLEYINDQYAQTGFFDINGNWSLKDQLPSLSATLNGDVNYLPLQLDVSANMQQSDNRVSGSASITGALGEKDNPGVLSISVEAGAENTSTLENLLLRTDIKAQDAHALFGRLGFPKLHKLHKLHKRLTHSN